MYNCTRRYGVEHIMSQDREWIKKQIKKILVNEHKMNEAFGQGGRHSDLWNTFVAPFTDIVKAGALGGQDILNAVKLNLDVLLALDPDTVKRAHEKYDERKAALDAKWKPIMDANKAAGGGDFELLTFAVNPGAFLGAKFAEKSVKAVPTVYDYMDKAGWSLPLRRLMPGVEPPKAEEKSSGVLGGVKDIVGKLADIFFIAHHAPKGPLIAEAEEDKQQGQKKQAIKDIDKEIKNYLEETGLDKVFEEQAQELVDMREEMMDDLLSKVVPQLDLLLLLMEASTPDAFEEALKNAKAAGMGQVAPANFMKQFEDQASEMVKNPDFKEELEKKKPNITDEEVMKTALSTVFSNAKEELQLKLEEGGEKIVQDALEALEYDMPPEDQRKQIEKTPVGKQFYDVYEKAKSKLLGYIQN